MDEPYTFKLRGTVDRKVPPSGWGRTVPDEHRDELDLGYGDDWRPWTESDGDNKNIGPADQMKVFSYMSITNENFQDKDYLPPSRVWLDDNVMFFVISKTQSNFKFRNAYWPAIFDELGEPRFYRHRFGRGPRITAYHSKKDGKNGIPVADYHLVYKYRFIMRGELDRVGRATSLESMDVIRKWQTKLRQYKSNNKPYWSFGETKYADFIDETDLATIVVRVDQNGICGHQNAPWIMDFTTKGWITCEDEAVERQMREGPDPDDSEEEYQMVPREYKRKRNLPEERKDGSSSVKLNEADPKSNKKRRIETIKAERPNKNDQGINPSKVPDAQESRREIGKIEQKELDDSETKTTANKGNRMEDHQSVTRTAPIGQKNTRSRPIQKMTARNAPMPGTDLRLKLRSPSAEAVDLIETDENIAVEKQDDILNWESRAKDAQGEVVNSYISRLLEPFETIGEVQAKSVERLRVMRGARLQGHQLAIAGIELYHRSNDIIQEKKLRNPLSDAKKLLDRTVANMQADGHMKSARIFKHRAKKMLQEEEHLQIDREPSPEIGKWGRVTHKLPHWSPFYEAPTPGNSVRESLITEDTGKERAASPESSPVTQVMDPDEDENENKARDVRAMMERWKREHGK